MLRYQQFAETIIDPVNNKRRYGTLYYPDIEPKSTDIYLITGMSDRLDLIAFRYYGDTRFWPVLARANKLHAASIRPPMGFRLRVPYPLDIGEIQDGFLEANEND